MCRFCRRCVDSVDNVRKEVAGGTPYANGYYVSLFVIDMDYGAGVTRAYRGANEERREIDDEGNGSYTSASEFC